MGSGGASRVHAIAMGAARRTPAQRRFSPGRVGHSPDAADKSNVRADTGDHPHDAAPLDSPETPRRDPTARRLYVFVSFLSLCFLALIFRYATLMTGLDFPAEGPAVLLPEVERGPILDRNGRVLALTIERDSVTAWVPAVTSPEDSAELLARILDTAAEEVLERLRGDGFVFVRRHVTPEQSARIRAALDSGQLQGIDLRPEQTRSYPEGALAAHLLGFVGVDNVGLEGIENTFNYVLAPDTITADGTGVFGNRVFLTIDVEVQHAMEALAAATRKEHDADAVFIIVADARSGEIMGYAAQPGFDPNNYAAFPSERWRNAIATDSYEPGSVFKVFTMGALLQTGAVTTSMTFPSPGYYRRTLPNGGVVRIGDLGVYGNLVPEQILRYSSNAGTAHASDQIDAHSFYRMLRAFGFGEPTGVPLLGESPGLLRPVAEWSGRSKPTIAIGHEISVTPLQIVQAATALTNGGTLLRPQLVRKIVAADGTLVKPFAPEPIRTVLAPETAATILAMMETVAEEGTGRLALLDGYRIGAKTGTAQVFDPNEGSYSDEHLIASILGVLPADAPRFIAYVVIQHPKGNQRYGGLIAAPVLHEVAAFLAAYYRLPREDEEPLLHPAHIMVSATPHLTLDSELPNLVGLPKRRLLPLLAMADLRLALHGSGYVVRQAPAPGSPLTPERTVHVWLE